MADKILKSIRFPSLEDTYVLPEIDDSLSTSGKAADAKATGDAIADARKHESVTGNPHRTTAAEIGAAAKEDLDDKVDCESGEAKHLIVKGFLNLRQEGQVNGVCFNPGIPRDSIVLEMLGESQDEPVVLRGLGDPEDGNDAVSLDYANEHYAPSSHVSNKSNPHGVTAAQVGAAPSGFGLGMQTWLTEITTLAQMDGTANCGWYQVALTDENIGGMDKGGLRVDAAPHVITQTFFGYSAASTPEIYECKRMWTSNTRAWGEWEWKNPPMKLWKEYRTTKRWQGNPVYAKAINMSSFPVNSYKTSGFGANATSIMNLHGELYYNGEWIPFPVHLNGELVAYCWTDGSNVGVTTLGDISSGNANFVIEYTKN